MDLSLVFNKLVQKVYLEKFTYSRPLFPSREPAYQPVQSAVEEIRDVVKKQERELDDLRARMRDSVS